ncbi:MAG TPA: hypothetical protein VLN08_15075 [Vicinamibacterales bacterium]|nr:hypothetical protein [Vicinamibacterales bacterium]
MRTILSALATLAGAMLLALAVPVAVLALGTPVALVVRLVLEAVRAL